MNVQVARAVDKHGHHFILVDADCLGGSKLIQGIPNLIPSKLLPPLALQDLVSDLACSKAECGCLNSAL